MPYWENVTRSFRIAWRYKYLWLIALFSGEASGGGTSYSQGTQGRNGPFGSRQQFADTQTAIVNWITSHETLIAIAVAAWLVLSIAFFILGAICEGATVRAAAEHDAERTFHLGWAWRSGLRTMWVVVRFRLLLFVLYLPVLTVIFGLAASIIAAVAGNDAAGGFIAVFGFLVVLAIPYGIYVYLLNLLGVRAVVLEQLKARAGVARGHRLLFKRLGRTLLVWLLSIGVGLAVGLVLGCFLALVFTPLVIVGVVIGSANSGAILPLIIVGGVILFIVSLALESFFAAQSSTYWTLAFRRLDLDYEPAAPAYQFQPPPPPPAPAPGV